MEINNFKIIAIAGLATSGKDYFCKYLQTKFPDFIERFALADELKTDLNPFLKQKTGISAFTISPDEKTLIRDILVAYGKVKRQQSKGTYWTGLLQPKIQRSISEGRLPVITDVRYDVYPEDEAYWSQNINRGCLIHLTRIDKDGKSIEPPNQDEAFNNPRLMAKANYAMTCPTFLSLKEPEKEADYFYSSFLEGVMNELTRRYEQFKERRLVAR